VKLIPSWRLKPGLAQTVRIRLHTRAICTQHNQVCDDVTHEDWLRKITLSNLLQQYKDKRLTIPGVVLVDGAVPEGMLETAPTRPTLNVLTWMKDVPDCPGMPQGLKIPENISQKWYTNPTHGDAFKHFYDELTELCGTELPEALLTRADKNLKSPLPHV
jgi:hypothetical protein